MDYRIQIPYSPEEMDSMRENLANEYIRMRRQKDAMKKIMTEQREILGEIEEEANRLMVEIEQGYREQTVHVVEEPDQERGIMQMIDTDGYVVGERRLLPHERQIAMKMEVHRG